MTPSRGHRLRGGAAFLALLATGAWHSASVAGELLDKEGTVETILSNLPEHGTAAYWQLFNAAGRPRGETLDMTKSEMWVVSGSHLQALMTAAASNSVVVTKLDDTWNHALTPMTGKPAMTDAQQQIMHSAMESKAAMGMNMMGLPSPGVEEYALTKGMHDTKPGAPQPHLVLPLSDGTTIEVRRTSIGKAAGGYAWHGVVEDTGEPVTLLWWPSGRMTGTVTYKNHLYAVRDFGEGMHGIIELKPDALPEDHAPMAAEQRQKMNMKDDPLEKKGDAGVLAPDGPTGPIPVAPPIRPDRSEIRDQEDAAGGTAALMTPGPEAFVHDAMPSGPAPDPITIRVILAYTKAAAQHYNDIKTDLIALAIEEANQSYRNSGIGQVQLELAHAYQTDYVESGTHFDHVFRFADKGDGYMEEVHALRDQYKADVALLIEHDPNGCGLAAEVYARPERAFAAMHHECAANMYSLGHEIGHLIGARHDEALDDTVQPFPYGHGFVNGKAWRTMMSYKDSCDGCPRLPLWSNPSIKVHGVRAGDEKSNNARVIAEQAARVAGFR